MFLNFPLNLQKFLKTRESVSKSQFILEQANSRPTRIGTRIRFWAAVTRGADGIPEHAQLEFPERISLARLSIFKEAIY